MVLADVEKYVYFGPLGSGGQSLSKSVLQGFFGVVSVGNKRVCVTGCFFRTLRVFFSSCYPLSVFCLIVASFEGCVLFNMLRCIFFHCRTHRVICFAYIRMWCAVSA